MSCAAKLPVPRREIALLDARAAGPGSPRRTSVSPATTIFRPLYSGGLWLPVTATPEPVLEMVRGEVDHRRGTAPDVDDVDAAACMPVASAAARVGSGQPAVAADGDFPAAALARLRADGAPDGLDDFGREGACRRCRGCRTP